ncbi:hypothetical protein ET495_03995 [Xylanimonas allomyrinae]|uniref:Uncharacterized protein n=1 Tax=Xylanimonas allomyrinae TaxID=2509459 RepID=A0A4P6EIX0_9MICO|nr:hypothetical protein [Xylanimonas allomyrinae]QAY62550.1 hypothetical protein ET495_03995 [Xylanimonas allomyrinae]
MISGVAVTLSEEEPLKLLPGVYDMAVDVPQDDALWAPPGSPEPETVMLGPGGDHVIELGAPEVTEAGRAAVQEKLEQLAQAKVAAMTDLQVSDRERQCGLLAPSGGFSAKDKFDDDWFDATTTNIANGATTVRAVSDNGAQGSSVGNGSRDTFADEAFCAGVSSPDSDVYDVPVSVVSSALTPGKVTVAADGTFGTTTPWSLFMETQIATCGDRDAAGVRVGWDEDQVHTTYTATVELTWESTG